VRLGGVDDFTEYRWRPMFPDPDDDRAGSPIVTFPVRDFRGQGVWVRTMRPGELPAMDVTRTNESVRLFMVPGMMHCRGGDGTPDFDMIPELDNIDSRCDDAWPDDAWRSRLFVYTDAP